MTLKLSASKEDYLKAIYFLVTTKGTVRVKDIAGKMEISMPSVSSALKHLEEQGLVCHSRYDLVELTAKGSRFAKDVHHRHSVLKDFLSKVLGLDSVIAEKDACGMEHSISPQTIDSLVKFLEKSQQAHSQKPAS